MSFGALKMTPSASGGKGPQKGRVGICFGETCEGSQFVSLFEDCAVRHRYSGPQQSHRCFSFLLGISLLRRELLAVSYMFSAHCSLLGRVHDLTVQLLLN